MARRKSMRNGSCPMSTTSDETSCATRRRRCFGALEAVVAANEHDVDVLRRAWTSVERDGVATDDDELNLAAGELLQQLFEVGRQIHTHLPGSTSRGAAGSRHARARLALRPSRARDHAPPSRRSCVPRLPPSSCGAGWRARSVPPRRPHLEHIRRAASAPVFLGGGRRARVRGPLGQPGT